VSRAGRRARSPAEIQRELEHTDAILHNLQGCILQIEGKLLTTLGERHVSIVKDDMRRRSGWTDTMIVTWPGASK
jgi:hypothetical protein